TEAPPARLPQHAFGESGSVFGGVRRGGTLDSRRIGDGTFVAHRQPFAVARFGAPDGADLDFPRFRRTVSLLARAPGQFFGPHRNAGTVEARIKSGRQRIFPDQWQRRVGHLIQDKVCIRLRPPVRPGVEPLLGGDLVAEGFGAAFHLAGINADASQFPQQLAAFLKTDHRTDCSNHADGGGRKAGLLDPQLPVTRIESAAAKLVDTIVRRIMSWKWY